MASRRRGSGRVRDAALVALLAALVGPALLVSPLHAQADPRARDLGIPFRGTPGPLNAITDVAGVEVGHTTLIRGEGRLVVGEGPVRTGVTAVHPRGRASTDPVFAAWFPLNGNGEMTGTTWVDESGMLGGPVMITNTHSVGVVRDAVVGWLVERDPSDLWLLPVVAETWDGVLNDLNGFHVRPEHAVAALESARGGPVEEGAVGGGTGMVCNGFKGGIGTASRRVSAEAGGYTVGVLVQCNYGAQTDLRIAGVPVGRELRERGVTGRCLTGDEPPSREWLRGLPPCDEDGGAGGEGDGSAAAAAGSEEGLGSIIIIVATDAPLLPHQLERLVKRAALGVARDGSVAHNGSGDIFVAFATGNTRLEGRGDGDVGGGPVPLEMLPNDRINPLFYATVQATEEAVVNAMVAAETMTGADGVRVRRIPHEAVREILEEYGRPGGR